MPDSTRAPMHAGTADPVQFQKRQLQKSGKSKPIRADHLRARVAALPALLKVSHIKAETGMSRATIYRKLDSGEIRSIRPTPRTLLVPLDWYIEWIEGRMAAAVEASR